MVRPLTPVLLAVVLLGAACDSDEEAADGSTTVESTTTTTTLPPHPGPLVIVDGFGDVITIEPDGSDLNQVTDHGGTVGVWQPLFAPDGETLMWSESGSDGFSLVVQEPDEQLRFPMASLTFYSMWSPDGSQIATLHNGPTGGVELEVIDLASEARTVVSSGASYYFSWDPEGTGFVSHIGGNALSVDRGDGASILDNTTGDFQAPSWSEAGLIYARGGLLIRRATVDSEPTVLADLPGPVTIAVGPSGRRVAVQSIGPDTEPIEAAFQSAPEIPANRVAVIDLESGSVEIATREPAFSFFWSPDGSALLLLTSSDREGELAWSVWQDGTRGDPVSFVPNGVLVRDVLPFFDQYSQSWSPWAADSSAFAFVGRLDGQEGVWVQHLGDDSPTFVTQGSWVAWSPLP